MTTTARQRVRDTVAFNNPGRLPVDFPPPYGTDFEVVDMAPSPDHRPRSGTDEWGAVWDNIGVSNLGEVKTVPLPEWSGWDRLRVPDAHAPERWEAVKGARDRAGGRFLLAKGISIYERVHFIRGLENTWMDIYQAPDRLCKLLDTLVDMNLAAIERYAAEGADGYIFPDDWGLQDRLMIAPAAWRTFWKPRYAAIYTAAHAAGMITFLHSCGCILEILDDLIEAGLDVIHMDQQENMGLDALGERFRGRINFFSPVDIQNTMVKGSTRDIRAYCRAMAAHLCTPTGGLIPRWYRDPAGAGHRQEALAAMCEEFLAINDERGAAQDAG